MRCGNLRLRKMCLLLPASGTASNWLPHRECCKFLQEIHLLFLAKAPVVRRSLRRPRLTARSALIASTAANVSKSKASAESKRHLLDELAIFFSQCPDLWVHVQEDRASRASLHDIATNLFIHGRDAPRAPVNTIFLGLTHESCITLVPYW